MELLRKKFSKEMQGFRRQWATKLVGHKRKGTPAPSPAKVGGRITIALAGSITSSKRSSAAAWAGLRASLAVLERCIKIECVTLAVVMAVAVVVSIFGFGQRVVGSPIPAASLRDLAGRRTRCSSGTCV